MPTQRFIPLFNGEAGGRFQRLGECLFVVSGGLSFLSLHPLI